MGNGTSLGKVRGLGSAHHGAHHWLILHGRYICKARKPRCGDCIVNDLCNFKDKTPAEA